MIKQKLRIRSALTIFLAVLFAASVPAFAEQGSGSSDRPTSTSTVSSSPIEKSEPLATPPSSGQSPHTTSGVQKQPENETNAQAGEVENHDQLHSQGESMVAQLHEQDKKNQSDKDRQNKCESHKQGLANKFDQIVNNSQRIQTKIDSILAKAQAYQQANHLNPANWSSLLASAQSAQADSAASITALKSVSPTVDCSSNTVASDVATFKVAAQQTRDRLKIYRDSVKALLQALETAKSTTEGSNQ